MLGFLAQNLWESGHFEHFKVFSGSYGNLKQSICWLLVEGAHSLPAMSCDSAGSTGVILLTTCTFGTPWSKKENFLFLVRHTIKSQFLKIFVMICHFHKLLLLQQIKNN